MIDLEKAIHGLIDPLVEKPEAIMIRQLPGRTDNDLTILIVAENDDTARLIGKRGIVANALREAIGVAGKCDTEKSTRIHLKFESFDEEDKSGTGDDAK